MKKNVLFLMGALVLLMGISFGYCAPLAEASSTWGEGNNPVSSYPNDFTFVEVPDPLSGDNPVYKLVAMDEPVGGHTFNDSHFKTELTRVTGRGKIRHEYSRFDPFNADQSMIVLLDIDSGEFIVYSTATMPYEQSTNLVRTYPSAKTQGGILKNHT
jgi:hypothetical protein